MTKSISQEELIIDESIKTAIFYPVPDLGNYIVEIRYNNENLFIGEHNNPHQFENMALAKTAAKKQGALYGFQAMGNTYQEPELTQPEQSNKRYEYLKVDL